MCTFKVHVPYIVKFKGASAVNTNVSVCCELRAFE